MRSELICVTGLLMALWAAAPVRAQSPATMASDIASDERIVFFTTSARQSADGSMWVVPVHGRVHRSVRSVARKALIAQSLKSGFGVAPDRESQAMFDARVDLLLADNKGGRRIVVRIGDQDHAMAVTRADGHFNGEIVVSAADASRWHQQSGRLPIAARLPTRDPRQFGGVTLLVPPTGVSVISDIDDTIKITNVTDTKRMLEATFLRPFEAVPGMARRYETWRSEGASFHFVSSTPWHFYEPIDDFIDRAGFPRASYALKQVRLKDGSIRNLFANGTIIKPPAIEALLAAHPRRTFVLVGDSGEKDPEIYAGFMRRYPERIQRILIRNVTNATAGDARFSATFRSIDPARWQLFSNADELPGSLR